MAFAPRRFTLALATALALGLAAPALAQGEDESIFGPLSTAEQAEIFDRGVAAYDAGNYEEAFGLWLPLAQRGNMSAQRNVGHMLRRGLGTEQDLPRAVYFYRRASESGLVSAMVNLAAMLRAGQGVEQPDYREAARWLYIASQSGDPRAQYVLGIMAARGQGMEADRDLAIVLFRLAAEQGLREAREQLAQAGIEPSNIGDEPERPEFSLPPELAPLPEVNLGEEPVAAATPPAAAPAPATAAVDPEPQLRTTRPSTPLVLRHEEPEPEPQPVQQAREPEPQPAAQPTQQAATQPTQVAPEPAAPATTTPQVQTAASQPAANPQPARVQGPPAPTTRRQPEPEPEEEAPDEDSPLGRLLGGTR